MLKIEFLYYDKNSCERCRVSSKSLSATMSELRNVIKTSPEEIILKETKLPASKLLQSPTILINGKDVETLVNGKKDRTSNECSDCCSLVGRSVNCRSFTYRGRKYDYIPRAMISEAIDIVSRAKKKR